MQSAKYPVVGGLYHVKTDPLEPMIYRGRGNGPYLKYKRGDVVMCDGLPTGCTLIHTKLLRAVAEHRNESYVVRLGSDATRVPRVFKAPREVWADTVNGTYQKRVGTSDLDFCDYVIEHKLLAKAGWGKLGKERYPFVVDTRIACGHIDRETGRVFG
jgi:hypothetical protein